MSRDPDPPGFSGLVNLAAGDLGARALACSDDFFASMHNLVRPGRGLFDPDAYGERGKIMDGWESRRKRETGHDWCVVELGTTGVVRVLDIDTNHFLGNHPPIASVEGIDAAGADMDALASKSWTEVLPPSPLRAGSQNVFAVDAADGRAWTHLRLNIHPDGGVARLRAYGHVRPAWGAPSDDVARDLIEPGEVDLAMVKHGGLAVACSDMFFGSMNNLLLPERARNMGGGWETKRRRGPGNDWIVVRLGARGSVGLLEVDTNHFKGNFPAECSVEGLDAEGANLLELTVDSAPWTPILGRQSLQAHTRHFFREQVLEGGPFSHVRLSIYPCGGVSRLRVFGQRAQG